MNKVILMGRWTRDPDVKYTQEGLAMARGTLAVDRRYKKDGENTSDFINLISFGKQAEFIEKYFRKGMKALICGRIQTGSYEKEGQKIYTTDVVIEEIEFAESKQSGDLVQEGRMDGNEFIDAATEGAEVFNY